MLLQFPQNQQAAPPSTQILTREIKGVQKPVQNLQTMTNQGMGRFKPGNLQAQNEFDPKSLFV